MKLTSCPVFLAVGLLLAGAGQAQHHLFTFPGDATNHYLYSCAGVGDIDKDGYVDVAAGTFYDRPNQNGYLKVFSGRTGKVLTVFRGDSASDWLGWSCDGCGDINKDSWPDIVVGSHRDDKNNLTDNGTVYVLSGAYIFRKIGQQILYQWHGTAAGDQLGRRVRGAGDVNKDGYLDIIAGAWQASGARTGYARVFSGKDGKVLYTFTGTGLYGTGVDSAGDVNNDGHADLVVGGHGSGVVTVYSGKDGKVIWTITKSGSLFGFQVAGVGDLDLDGIPEVVVSASSAATLYVYDGRTGKEKAKIVGTGNLGYSINGGGDVNRDGFPDFAAGSSRDSGSFATSGQIWVISGLWFRNNTSPQVLHKFSGRAAGDQIGIACDIAGDINKDGHADVLGGAWYNDLKGMSCGAVSAFSGKALTMTTDTHYFQVSKASTQNMTIHAGAANAGRNYWIFGSFSGTTPGITLGSGAGPVTIPLNPDLYTDVTIAFVNTGPFVKTRGVLDSKGTAIAQLKGGPVSSSLVGLALYHAALVYDQNNNFYLGTNPTTLLLEQ